MKRGPNGGQGHGDLNPDAVRAMTVASADRGPWDRHGKGTNAGFDAIMMLCTNESRESEGLGTGITFQ